MRAVDADYVPQSGEVVFDAPANGDQLETAFPSYAGILAANNLIDQAAERLFDSDLTMTRTAEAVSLGLTTWTTNDVVTFVEYRRELRSIIKTGSGSIPTKPPYPEGT